MSQNDKYAQISISEETYCARAVGDAGAVQGAGYGARHEGQERPQGLGPRKGVRPQVRRITAKIVRARFELASEGLKLHIVVRWDIKILSLASIAFG